MWICHLLYCFFLSTFIVNLEITWHNSCSQDLHILNTCKISPCAWSQYSLDFSVIFCEQEMSSHSAVYWHLLHNNLRAYSHLINTLKSRVKKLMTSDLFFTKLYVCEKILYIDSWGEPGNQTQNSKSQIRNVDLEDKFIYNKKDYPA